MLLEGRDIHFKYGNEIIFNNFSFELREGEKLVLKGESGSGKSTLFRLILGFEHPESGKFLYNGSILKNGNLKFFRKETSWLPQDLNIGDGTVKEVIMYPFQFKIRSGHKPKTESIENLLNNLGLKSTILDKPFSDLSTGQRQRIGILICILMEKPLMLLDEPTSALDRDSKEKLANLLLNSNRTILSTSHDPFWVERCDRIIEIQ